MTIDWSCLIAQRSILLKTVDAIPRYLLKPEVQALLSAEKDATYRLILDLMWCTGAKISEILLLRTESFTYDGYDYSVILTNLKPQPGRPCLWVP